MDIYRKGPTGYLADIKFENISLIGERILESVFNELDNTDKWIYLFLKTLRTIAIFTSFDSTQ
ncbi:7878_t:CDS:2 [Entrophospora sp. SA101]|nr:7878_t:CDS:2 [Entrophospora sp. SA101]